MNYSVKKHNVYLSILNGRIQTFLKEIVKILKMTSSKKLVYENYKEMYSISLRLNDTATTFPRDLYDAIGTFEEDFMRKIPVTRAICFFFPWILYCFRFFFCLNSTFVKREDSIYLQII